MPIMQNLKIEKKEGQEFDPIPEGIHQAELIDISAEDHPTYSTRNKPDNEKEYETILNFEFGLLGGNANGKPLRGRKVWRNFVPAYLYISTKNGKNVLYQIVEAMLRRQLTPQDEATLDTEKLNKLIGHQVVLGVKNKVKDGKTYSNVEQFYPIQQMLPKLTDEEKSSKKEDVQQVETTGVMSTIEMTSTGATQLPLIQPEQSDEIRLEDILFN